ncbi:hypothetical protein [Rheinheimera sp.]|uniref:hypothetical protein n=1 Tax=Rheinheimera sp. TaxID=1869214 RepID=UPI002354181A|nr:hypothetical protein [Rheinheimera sp.]
MRLILLTAIVPFMLAAAENQATHCQLGDAVRVIEVVYPEGAELPCEVHYGKDGQSSVLWRASSEVGYCEQKAAEFAEKQRGWGWQCVVTAGKSQAETSAQPEG